MANMKNTENKELQQHTANTTKTRAVKSILSKSMSRSKAKTAQPKVQGLTSSPPNEPNTTEARHVLDAVDGHRADMNNNENKELHQQNTLPRS